MHACSAVVSSAHPLSVHGCICQETLEYRPPLKPGSYCQLFHTCTCQHITAGQPHAPGSHRQHYCQHSRTCICQDVRHGLVFVQQCEAGTGQSEAVLQVDHWALARYVVPVLAVWDAVEGQHPTIWCVDLICLQGVACCQYLCE